MHLYKYNKIITKDGHLSWHTSKTFELEWPWLKQQFLVISSPVIHRPR